MSHDLDSVELLCAAVQRWNLGSLPEPEGAVTALPVSGKYGNGDNVEEGFWMSEPLRSLAS